MDNGGASRNRTLDAINRLNAFSTYSAVSSKLKQTLYLLLAVWRRGKMHGVGVGVVGGGVFALKSQARVFVCGSVKR